ncbi:hypothetical protein NFI96_023197 [Prochilodus magdalenae]|nr:hypothetical protein NFI96_023197 [Prochilodus magdalenae]
MGVNESANQRACLYVVAVHVCRLMNSDLFTADTFTAGIRRLLCAVFRFLTCTGSLGSDTLSLSVEETSPANHSSVRPWFVEDAPTWNPNGVTPP